MVVRDERPKDAAKVNFAPWSVYSEALRAHDESNDQPDDADEENKTYRESEILREAVLR